MATREISKSSDVLADIAKELGISPEKLASMDCDAIRDLIESGDLDPGQKAKLVRSKLKTALQEANDVADLASDVLGDGFDGDGKGNKGGKGGKGSPFKRAA